MVGQGCQDNKKTTWPISTYFHPTLQKINSHVTICSVVRDLAYPFSAVNVHIGHGLRNISSAQTNVICLCNTKVGFSILWNHCSCVSGLQVEIHTKELATTKWSVSGVRTRTKTTWPISTYFHPTFQKVNSHVTTRSVVRDLAYPVFNCKRPYRPWS